MPESERDVSAEIVAALPAHLRPILAELETSCGKGVRFLCMEVKLGGAFATFNFQTRQPEVRLRPQLRLHDGWDYHIISHEVLHLRRWADHHPIIAAKLSTLRSICNGLLSVAEDFAVYPTLRSFGYPAGEEHQPTLQRYSGELAAGRLWPHDIDLERRHAVTFAIAILLAADTAERTRFLDFYALPEFRNARDRGHLIVSLIDGNQDETPSGTHSLLYRLATEALDLPPTAFGIEPNWVWRVGADM